MNSFNCPSCNAHNSSNARFCTSCGANLSQVQSTPYQTPSSQPEASLVSAFAFAGFWKRVIAYILDGIIFSFLFGVMAFLLGGSIFTIDPQNPANFMAFFGIYALFYPAWWLYFALM